MGLTQWMNRGNYQSENSRTQLTISIKFYGLYITDYTHTDIDTRIRLGYLHRGSSSRNNSPAIAEGVRKRERKWWKNTKNIKELTLNNFHEKNSPSQKEIFKIEIK